MNERRRNNIIAASIALLVVGIIIVIIGYFVHLRNENIDKTIKITPTFTGRSSETQQ